MPSQDQDQQLAAMLARLWLHYPNPDYSPVHWQALTEDYIEALRMYPLEVVGEAMKACRRKMKFRPTISEMLAEVLPRMPKPKAVEPVSTMKAIAPPTADEVARRLAKVEAMPDGPLKVAMLRLAKGGQE
jgi:hypothetical protein